MASSQIDPALAPFHRIIGSWFAESLGTPSEPQRQGWPVIATGSHTLILAPTGSGKTLAAFLWELNALITEGLEGPLANAVHLLYVSPLKALNNDIQRNLTLPLTQLKSRFQAQGEKFPEIRVDVRTGDTPQSARSRMIRKAPHILITTPESLHIMLTTLRGRGMFSGVRAVIVDEIHAIAGSKRGAHLALTLERLEHLVDRPVQRIALSATQRPLDEVARFLGGGDVSAGTWSPRPVSIVDCGLVRRAQLRIVSPVEDLRHVGESVWPAIFEQIAQHLQQARTTLVFCNNRAHAEKIATRVNALAGSEVAHAYHGALSRERRLHLEQRLKAGDLRALTTTSALELGIDIGSVDLVIQIQSPKRVTSALQRVGRAGHSLGAVSRGIFLPTHLDDALETLAITAAAREGDVEPTQVPQNPLDVLAQIVVATVAADPWHADDLFVLVRRAYPFHRLTRAAFDEVLAMLSGKYSPELTAELAPRILWDRTTGRLEALRGSRQTAIVSGGTIPDRGHYAVLLGDRTRIGELDEEFVLESRVGDVFLLGSTTWRFSAIEHDRVIVTPAPGAPARMPFWKGEYMARSAHVTARIGALRRTFAELDSDDQAAVEALATLLGCDAGLVSALSGYMREQRAVAGVVPDDRTLLLESFRDETGAAYLILHSPYGGRVNAPFAMALSARLRARFPTIQQQVQTTDDGVLIRLGDFASDPPTDVAFALPSAEAEQSVLREVGGSPLFGAHFRMSAGRALLLPRARPGKRMPLWLQRLKALDLLDIVREHASFPILLETYREVLNDSFDVPAFRQLLDTIERGGVRLRTAALSQSSPFARSARFVFVMDWLYVDDTPHAERRVAELSLDTTLLRDLLGAAPVEDDTYAALLELVAERRGTAARFQARDNNELLLLLGRAGDLTRAEIDARLTVEARHAAVVEDLIAAGHLAVVRIPTASGRELRYTLPELAPEYRAAFARKGRIAARERAMHAALIVRRFLATAAPVSVDELRQRYALPRLWVERVLSDAEAKGDFVQGRFPPGDESRWCARRLFERARRRALAKARRAVQPVPLPAFVAFLQRWQHIDTRDNLESAEGCETIVRQLAGAPLPPESLDREILAPRLVHYDPTCLTRMSSTGELVWSGVGRVRKESGMLALAAVRLVQRGQEDVWLTPAAGYEDALGDNARSVLAALRTAGARFLADLQRDTKLTGHALREALREMVAAGLVTADGFDALREVARLRPLHVRDRVRADPTRWLPADFERQSPIGQRRPNVARLPRWQRPDRPGRADGWAGRWAALSVPNEPPPPRSEAETAAAQLVAQAWLDRYGIVARDIHRREQPNVPWRAVYEHLRAMELRGVIRRGYFVQGLSGAQFALADAVERLRGVAAEVDPSAVCMNARDPANAFRWARGTQLEKGDAARGPNPARALRALLVTRAGRPIFAVEGRLERIRRLPNASDADVVAAALALTRHLRRAHAQAVRPREYRIRTIDDTAAVRSQSAPAFIAAGWRQVGLELIFDPRRDSTAALREGTT
ncbi:MAG: DEAD/DEAH box helicase [Gemmatimonadaceae bacterium]